MPMAQALVMVRHKVESALDPVLSPMRSPLGPQLDTSLITSSVRKRKPEAPRDVEEEAKKLRQEPAEPSRRASYGLAQTGPLLREAGSQQQAAAECDPHSNAHPHAPQHEQQHQQERPHAAAEAEVLHPHAHPHALHHPQQQQQAGGGGSMLGTLFSPVFHLLHKEGSGAEACPAAGAATPGPSGLATPAPVACPAGPRLPGTEGCEPIVAAALEDGVPLRPHTPPPEPAADSEPASDCHVRLLSPLASPKPVAQGETQSAAAPCTAAAVQPRPAVAAAAQQVAEESEEEYDELEFDPLLFIKRLPPLEQCVPVRRTSFLLPRQTRRSKRKTLVLDLDETLVHSTLDGFCRPDFTFPVEVGNVKHMVSVRRRPHLHTFLERVARLFEVVVFTASQRVYAEQLLNVIDPGRCLIRHRVYRESCVFWEGNYLKDLTVLGRDLRDTVIVDNSPQAFGFQLDNGIPIESWYDDDADEELLRLLPFLEQLAGADDVRPHIQSHFKLRQMVEATPDPPRRYAPGLGALLGY